MPPVFVVELTWVACIYLSEIYVNFCLFKFLSITVLLFFWRCCMFNWGSFKTIKQMHHILLSFLSFSIAVKLLMWFCLTTEDNVMFCRIVLRVYTHMHMFGATKMIQTCIVWRGKLPFFFSLKIMINKDATIALRSSLLWRIVVGYTMN